MSPTGQRVADFVEAVVSDERRADTHSLIELMSDLTGETARVWGGGIVGFGTYHYRYASGHEGDAPLASFAPRKAGLVVYLVGGFDDRHAAQMRRLGPHRTGKGCLYLKRLSDVDLTVLRTLVDRSVRVRRRVDEVRRE